MPRIVLYAATGGPPLTTTLKVSDETGALQPVDLSGHTVHFAARLAYDTTGSTATYWKAVAVPAADQVADKGKVTYVPAKADLTGKVPGLYNPQWIIDDGQATEQVITIPDQVELRQNLSDSPSVAYGAAAYALTTVQRVKELASISDFDPQPDRILQRYINAASRQIIDTAEREFAPAVDAQTRSFVVSQGGIVVLTPSDLRVLTTIETTTYTTGGSIATPLVSGTYEVSTSLPGETATRVYTPTLSGGVRVTITGDWGFASVPEDVAELCADQVVFWYRANQMERTSLASVEADTDTTPSGAPLRLSSATRAELISNWRAIPVA